MEPEILNRAVELGKRRKRVYVATADRRGLPHLAAAGDIEMVSEDRIAVAAWFCPGTVRNVGENPRIAVVAWDPETDTGHQMVGEVERMEETAVMDGFVPAAAEGEADSADGPLPQSERRLIIRIDEVLAFSHAPHADVVE